MSMCDWACKNRTHQEFYVVCVQCGHAFSLEMARSRSNFVFTKALCRLTMCQVPPFYSLIIKLDSSGTPIGANCKCPAGKS